MLKKLVGKKILRIEIMTDPIADYLTRLRNALMARHKIVEIPSSNIKKGITKIYNCY